MLLVEAESAKAEILKLVRVGTSALMRIEVYRPSIVQHGLFQ